MEPLTPVGQKISQARYNKLYELYMEKRDQVTLDGKPAAISRLHTTFPTVFIRGGDHGHEWSSQAVERILNSHCQFKS